MYRITKNNIIMMNRGDYFKFPIAMYFGDFPVKNRFVPEEGDFMYFALMTPNEKFETAFLKKEYTYKDVDEDGNLIVTIYPEDTINLDPGTYYYEVKALYTLEDEQGNSTDKDYHIDTFVQKTKFFLVD